MIQRPKRPFRRTSQHQHNRRSNRNRNNSQARGRDPHSSHRKTRRHRLTCHWKRASFLWMWRYSTARARPEETIRSESICKPSSLSEERL